MNRVFQERVDEIEVELFDTGALRTELATDVQAISTFVPPNLETRMRSSPAVPQVMQSSSEQEQSSDVLDRLGEAPARRTVHPRRRLGPVNQTTDTTSGTSRSETTTTTTSREERHPDRSSRCVQEYALWHIYKQDLMKLNFLTARLAADAMRMLNGARLSVIGLYSILGLVWLKAAVFNFSSTTALRRLAGLEGLPSNNTMGPVNVRPLQGITKNKGEQTREERPRKFVRRRAPTG